MKHSFLITAMALAGLLLGVSETPGQKGIGEAEGLVRSGKSVTRLELAGAVDHLATHPCTHTTGRADEGTHLHLNTDDGRTLNIHLGPADAVAGLLPALEPGQRVSLDAFRTADLPDGQAVAITVRREGGEVMLRDPDTLKPVWSRSGRGPRRAR